jgi:hypothetical protein
MGADKRQRCFPCSAELRWRGGCFVVGFTGGRAGLICSILFLMVSFLSEDVSNPYPRMGPGLPSAASAASHSGNRNRENWSKNIAAQNNSF